MPPSRYLRHRATICRSAPRGGSGVGADAVADEIIVSTYAPSPAAAPTVLLRLFVDDDDATARVRAVVLAVDREGFPVIRGGNYKIEARGIVD